MPQFKLQFPVKVFKIFQYFGNVDPIYTSMGLKGHNGLDLVAVHGTPVYAAHDGHAYYEVDASGGHGVVIVTNDQFEYEGKLAYFKTIYWHLVDSEKEPQYKSPIEGHNGMQVNTGDVIGYADNTGITTGDHLHFGCKVMQPGEYPGSWMNIEQHSGYLGAIDPFPYFEQRVPYRFTQNLMYGNEDYDQVNDMQHFLFQRGFMDLVPPDQQGYYGKKTAAAVLLYQNSKWKLSFADKLLGGRYWGPKTRAAANLDS